MTPEATHSIDPITFDDRTIWGLDPAVHWVRWNNQNEQFPEIVLEITKHWNERDWLVKLTERLGYEASVYDAETSPKGIFARPFEQKSTRGSQGQEPGLTGMRFFALRAAGVKMELCIHMFHIPGTLNPINLSKEMYDEMNKARRTRIQESEEE